MYCEKCGYPLNENGFCPVCGCVQPAANQYGTQQGVPQYGQQGMQQTPQYGQYGMQQQGMQQSSPQYGQYGMQQQGMQHPSPQYGQYGMQQQAPLYGQYGMQKPSPQYGQYNMPQTGQNAPCNQPSAFDAPFELKASAPKKKKSKAPIIITISIILIALIIGIVFLVKKVNDDKSGSKKSKKTTESSTEIKSTESTTEKPPTTSAPVPEAKAGTKTIMIYMVGSDLESKYGAASEDILEMLSSNFDEENLQVVIYTGGSNKWENSTIPEKANTVLTIENGTLTVVEKDSKMNMGDANTLSGFLNYAYTNFPAEKYSLILWNHGGGAFFGYGYDETTNDSLTLDELDKAFSNSPFTGDNKLEWIGFDACLMATIETAHTLAPYANYMISSQEPEPGWGWNYDFLNDIEELNSGKDIGAQIADHYMDYCNESFDNYPYSYIDVTLSVMDLSEIDNVETALNNLFAIANDDLSQKTYSKYSRIRGTTKEIASQYTGENSYDVVDLVDLSQQMSSLYPNEAKELSNALKKLVVYNKTNASKSYGVSVYFPYNAKEYSGIYIPMYSKFDFALEYTSFITNFSVLLTGDNTLTAEWDPNTMYPTYNGDYTFSMNLTPEQAANVQNIYYVVSRADTNTPGNYNFVSMSSQVTLDSTNKITANFDGNIIYMQNDTTKQQYEVMYTEQEKTDQYTRYLLSSILYNNDIQEDDAMYAYFVMETTAANPQGTILGAYPIANYVNSDGLEVFPERYEINIYDYKNIAFGSFSHKFTTGEDLTNFDESDWSDLVLQYNALPVTDGFSTVQGTMIPGIPYYGMFIIEDLQGNRHSSNLVQIQ